MTVFQTRIPLRNIGFSIHQQNVEPIHILLEEFKIIQKANSRGHLTLMRCLGAYY